MPGRESGGREGADAEGAGDAEATGGAEGTVKPLSAGDPRRIGPYRVLGVLGAGGMGRVFLARSEGGRAVAVKVVHQEYATDTRFRARFRREIAAARTVGERHTAPVLDADPDAEPPWVATGYVAGLSLEQVVRLQGPLPASSVHALADGMLRALKDIHAAGIVHRDLKPSNVMLTVEGVRVIDFGIARAVQSPVESLLTSTGMVIGSPGFMAPEQISGDGARPVSDVFALGCMLSYAATGRHPFAHGATNQHAVMFRVVQAEPELDAITDEPLRALVARCLTKDPDRRPTVDELLSGPDRPVPAAAADAWLPAAVVVRLARLSAGLLDIESGAEAPSGKSGETVQLRGPKPTVAATAVSEAPPTPAPAPTPTPAEPPQRARKRSWLIAVAVVPVVVAGGGTALVLLPGDGGSPGASASHSSTAPPSASNSPSAAAASPSGTVSPGTTAQPTTPPPTPAPGKNGRNGQDGRNGSPAPANPGTGTSRSTSGGTTGSTTTSGGSTGGASSPKPPSSAVPATFVGTWSVPSANSFGNDPQKLVVSRAAIGQNAVRYSWDVYGMGHCEYTARLDSVSANGKQLHVTSGTIDPAHSGQYCNDVAASTFVSDSAGTIRRVYSTSNPNGITYNRT
ncbi:serine/threonine-protein kinase [Streptomyces sp. NRRL F-5123]|uniref:serine/threonine-protein kinase n=1 Tax=Streptomyces sp. NRRL F-5123 TaxID=1463856 RepID=UPI0007C5207B|nr:serine/threonine-protein kinase [Streptomyces sp. NRRL F-5123]